MKINIKPTIIVAYEDYHEFCPYKDEDFMSLGFPMNYFELDTSLEYGFSTYKAVTWAKGSEDELFEFIFMNEEVWTLLVNAK